MTPAQQERMNDRRTLVKAKERADAIAAKLPDAALAELGDRMMQERSVERRTMWLHMTTNLLAHAAEGIVPCRAGCSHCCNMATIISMQEAEKIAAASGRTMAKVPQSVFEQDDEIDRVKYSGVPCPMLVDKRCSVYDARPFACRKHYSVDADNLLCQIVPGGLPASAPSYNAQVLDQLWVYAHAGVNLREGIQMADIRDFFPDA